MCNYSIEVIVLLSILYCRLICVYLSCKVEEFNVSISQFCDNLPRGSDGASETILNHELLVLQELNFQLTVHNPFRPLEGFLIDLKVTIFPWVGINCNPIIYGAFNVSSHIGKKIIKSFKTIRIAVIIS